MRGSPWLLPLRIKSKPFGNLGQFLSHEHKLQRSPVHTLHTAVFLLYSLLELLEKIFPHDIYDLSKSGMHSIIYRIINNGFSIWTKSVHLLESTIAASHTSRKNQKSRFHIIKILVFTSHKNS